MKVSTVIFSLSFKQLWCHYDTAWIYLRATKLFKTFLAIVEGKSFIWCFVAKFSSAVGINVVHHVVDVRLCEFVEGRAFR